MLVFTLGQATFALRIPGWIRVWRWDTERHRVMVPLAWAGLVAYAALLAVQAVTCIVRGQSPALFEAGATRHAFMLGFVAPLLIAMAQVVFERFGTGRVHWRNGLTAACTLLPDRVAAAGGAAAG